MEHKIFKLSFKTGVHLGEGSLEDSGINLRADTLFSALCIETLKRSLKSGEEVAIRQLYEYVQNNELVLSDAFPYTDNDYYLPKPIFNVISERNEGDSRAKKVFKNLKYIPIDMVDDYITGEFDIKTAEYISKKFGDKFGRSTVNTRSAVRREDDSLPYHVGVYRFGKEAGLYVIVGGTDKALTLFGKLLEGVSHAGIGGKRSSGLGRFNVVKGDVPDEILERLNGEYPVYMTLSVSLPRENEIEKVVDTATYTLLRRSGFVYSDTYSDEQLRKNDLYVFGSGSVVRQKYSGNVYDVSNKGAHSVYRYAKPMFYGVNV